ncbi:unnamed protein product [Bathycoccus prasinos]
MAVRIQPTAAPEHPGLTREMLLAVVLLLCANIATVCSGIALVAYGTRSGQKAVLLNKIFEGSDYEATVFDDPGESGDAGVYTRNKLMLILYHGWTFFALIGFVYAICVLEIYRQNAPAMVESYFNGEEVNIDEGVTRQGDEIEFFNISTLAQIDNAKNLTTIDAITWINHVDDSSKASVVFILIAMFSASFIMGVRYTARRMGGFSNVAGWIFGIVLAVLSFTVAKSTYRVNDAIAVDLNTRFVHEYGVDPWRAITLKETLEQYPEDIFLPPVLYDSPPPAPLAPGEIEPPAPEFDSPPAPVGKWYADGVWVEYARLNKISEIQHDVSCRLALTGVNHTEGRVSTDFVDWIKFQVADYAAVETSDVDFLSTKEGAEHPIAGKHAAKTLGGAAVFVVIASAAGIYGTLKHDRRLLALHLLISVPCGIFVVVAARKAAEGADDTFESMRLHWHALQHAYIGPAVTTGSAAAFASAHFKQAAALGAIVASVIWLAIFSSIGMIITHDATKVPGYQKPGGASDIENQRLASGPSSSASPLDSSKLGGGGTGKVAENIVEMKSLAATVRDAATGRGQFKPGFRPTELKETKKSGATPARGGRPKGGDKDLDAKFSVD